MNPEASFRCFVAWIIVGMGFHIGWAVIALIIHLISQALGR